MNLSGYLYKKGFTVSKIIIKMRCAHILAYFFYYSVRQYKTTIYFICSNQHANGIVCDLTKFSFLIPETEIAYCAIFGWPSFVRLPRKEFIYLGNWVTEHIYYSMSNFLYVANCFFVISGLFLKSTLINFLHLKRSLDKMFFLYVHVRNK